MSEKTIFICKKYPELTITMKPTMIAYNDSGRPVGNTKGKHIGFRRNPSGYGQFITSDPDEIAAIKRSLFANVIQECKTHDEVPTENASKVHAGMIDSGEKEVEAKAPAKRGRPIKA